MDNANICVVDDQLAVRVNYALALPRWGHNVLFNVGTVEEALEEIDFLQEAPDVALLDGYIDTSRPAKLETRTQDGQKIAYALRAKFGKTVTIVSISGFGSFAGSERHIEKHDLVTMQKFIKNLPQKGAPVN